MNTNIYHEPSAEIRITKKSARHFLCNHALSRMSTVSHLLFKRAGCFERQYREYLQSLRISATKRSKPYLAFFLTIVWFDLTGFSNLLALLDLLKPTEGF